MIGGKALHEFFKRLKPCRCEKDSIVHSISQFHHVFHCLLIDITDITDSVHKSDIQAEYLKLVIDSEREDMVNRGLEKLISRSKKLCASLYPSEFRHPGWKCVVYLGRHLFGDPRGYVRVCGIYV